MLDLADFDYKLIHIPGSKLNTFDALSRQLDLIPKTDIDNEEVTLLPPSLFINIINTGLNKTITKSSEKNSLVLHSLQGIEGEEQIPAHFKSRLSDWSYNAGILTYQGWVYIPDCDNLCHEIVKLHHDHQTARHPSFLKTHQLVSASYWWPGLAQYIWKCVEGCAICQQDKTNTQLPTPHLNPISSEETLPFKQISYDLITGLPLSNGFDALLVMVDHGLSKGVILCPTKKTITADSVAAIIFNKLYTHFGHFNKVISHWGPQFAANFTKELSQILGCEISLSTAYHPQTDEEAEQLDQEIETYLCIFCGSHPETWVDHIPMAKFIHNHCPHSSTRKSLFYLMLGYEL